MAQDLERVRQVLQGKTILITGGTGFIGSCLAETLSSHSKVLVLSQRRKHNTCETIQADLTGKGLVEALRPHQIDLVFHYAGFLRPYADLPEKHLAINALGTKNLLDCCRILDIERIVFASTGSVFGRPLYLPVDETHPKIPEQYYGQSKLLAEHFVNEYQRYHNLKTTILRFGSVYGPGQLDEEVIPILLRDAIKTKSLTIINGGRSSNDFIYINDVIQASVLGAVKPDAINQDFNIGTGIETTIAGIARTISGLTNNSSIEFIQKMPDITTNFVFNTNKAKKILQFIPQYDLLKGLEEQIKYLRLNV